MFGLSEVTSSFLYLAALSLYPVYKYQEDIMFGSNYFSIHECFKSNFTFIQIYIIKMQNSIFDNFRDRGQFWTLACEITDNQKDLCCS